jgi:hypothetical protein
VNGRTEITTYCPRKGDIILRFNDEPWEVTAVFPLIDRATDADGYEYLIEYDGVSEWRTEWDDDAHEIQVWRANP